MTNPADRFFGKTKVDALYLDQSSWYISGSQVTASADELNAAGDGITTINAYNATGGAFAAGMLLHVSGYDATSGYLKVEKADADNSKPAQYVATTTTASLGTAIVVDYLNAVTFNTTGASAGDPVYLSAATPGTFSLAAPTGADDVVQIVGRVKLHNNAAGTVIIDLRKIEQVKIGTNEYVDASITDAKLADDVATGLAGTAGNSALTATSGVLEVDVHAATDATVDVAVDRVLISDEGETGDPTRSCLVSALATGMAGTGLNAVNGALILELNEIAAVPVDVAADSMVFVDEGTTSDPTAKTSIADLVSGMAGLGMVAASGQLAVSDNGQYSHGGVFFTGAGDCTSITVGPTAVYPRSVSTQDNPVGQWSSASGTASGCATALAAAINGDQRNSGGPYYSAEAVGAGVIIRGVTPSNANGTVARTDATEPSAVQNLVLGYNASSVQIASIYHVVTLFDLMLPSFTLQTPFALNTFIVQVLNSSGKIRTDVTDTFTFASVPAGVLVTSDGGTHLAAGDIITVMAISL